MIYTIFTTTGRPEYRVHTPTSNQNSRTFQALILENSRTKWTQHAQQIESEVELSSQQYLERRMKSIFFREEEGGGRAQFYHY